MSDLEKAKNGLVHRELADTQTILLETLSDKQTAAEIHEAVNKSALPDDFKQWLLSSEPDMLETAAQLVKKWQSKNPDDGVGL